MDERRSLEAGADAFLPKPVDFDRLLDRMASLLSIEWRYIDEPAMVPRAQHAAAVSMVPQHDLLQLHRLARHGDIREIQRFAEHIAATDERHTAFARQLSGLASHYQIKAILELVEQQLNEGAQR